MDFKPGGLVPDGPIELYPYAYHRPHPWKAEFLVPLAATPGQVAYVLTVQAFQKEIELLDTSWLDEQ
ncbi:hypothetical protein GCM10009837_08080 [Streptomyces durmitorensis]|uniref:Uncharacterized protein n=1 Tax=Streptomyces durmitorensis TaxID=319947 RepID=A0ABY4PLQ7_9ACTN|nr:hypothetical protein [Streptomyces durmitorensis]UQT54305.1 hypothetical protein M4V62_03980 [Streptomyces durmitorensis]